MKRYSPETEHEIMRTAATHFGDGLPKLNQERLVALVELLNGAGPKPAMASQWSTGSLRYFLSSRMKQICAMNDMVAPRGATKRRNTKSAPTKRQVRAQKAPSFTAAALNGSGDYVRTLLDDKKLNSDAKVTLLRQYLDLAVA
jgi:hypothetical protein